MSYSLLLLATLFLQQGGGSGFPAVAADEGTIHVVWQDDVDGNQEILYSRSTANGSFTRPLNISRNPGISDLPRVAVRKNVVSVVWSDMSTGIYQVMLAQSQDGGTNFAPARTLSDGRASTGPPDIVCPDEHCLVVWDETDNDGENRIVCWDSSGDRRSIPGSAGGFVPSIAAQGRRVVVAWHTERNYKRQVYLVHSDDSEKSFSEPVLISADLEQSQSPSVSIAPNGRVFVAWSDASNGKSEIFISSSETTGENFSPPAAIGSRAGESILPSVKVVDDDSVVLAWTTRTAIVSATMSTARELKDPPTSLTNTGSSSVPRLAVDGSHSIIVWGDFRDRALRIFVSKDNGPAQPIH
jgi:hypothetical protein